MKKILILGGSSDIGTELLSKLIEVRNVKLHIQHNKKKNKIKKDNKIKFIKKDLSNLNDKNLIKYFDNNYDIIINLVGYISNQSFLKFNFLLSITQLL